MDPKTQTMVALGAAVGVNCIPCFDRIRTSSRQPLDRLPPMKARKSYPRFRKDFSLDQIQNALNPEQFFRINRNFIINIDYIDSIHAFSSSRLKISLIKAFSDNDLIVSRDRVGDFKNWMDR